MKVEDKFSNGTEIDLLTASAYAEGYCEGQDASTEDQLRAWAYLIATGVCWQLQGWYGRTASSLLENDLISHDGIIDWERVEELA